MKMVVKE